MKKMILFILVIIGCSEPISKIGVIKEKAAGYNPRTLSFEYHTIVRCTDGYIRDVKGIEAYSKPIGSTITFIVYE